MSEFPTLPTDDLDERGWTESERREEILFELPTATVRGFTVQYEDERLRTAVREATDGDVDLPLRFLFATRLEFRPPPVPGVGTASMQPSVVAEARSNFADRLRDRGFERVDRGRSQRMPTESGDRASLVKYTARYPIEGYDALDVEGWLAVWAAGSSFRIAGGVYPVEGIPDVGEDGPTVSPSAWRSELLDVLRCIE